MPNNSITVARVIKPFGLRGRVAVEPLTDFPERFAPGSILFIDDQPFEVTASRPQRQRWVLKFKDISTPEDAETLRGALLQIPESQLHPLPDGQYYRFQIVGLLAVTKDGRELGPVKDVLETPANDVYQVQTPTGDLLVPALPEFVMQVDLEAGRMIIEEMEVV